MLVNDITIALSFVLAVISLISIFFTNKKILFTVITVVLFGFFYYQNTVHNVADNMTIITFVMGMTLIALEIFIPSFGVIGIIGILLTVYSVLDSFSDNTLGFLILILSGLAIVLTVTIYVKLGFSNNLFDSFVLTNSNSSSRGYNAKKNYEDLIGKVGTSKTILRPTGRIEIDGVPYDAMTEGDFIVNDKLVQVIAIRDGHIIVRETNV